MTDMSNDFYEEDEPIEDVLRAFEQAEPCYPITSGTWGAPPRCTCNDLPRSSFPYFMACPLHPATSGSTTTTIRFTR